MKHPDTKSFILKWLKTKGEVRTQDIAKALGLSRQTAHQHFQELARQHKLSRVGSTIDSRYVPYAAPKNRADKTPLRVGLHKALQGLKEDEVFNQVAFSLELKKRLSKAAYKICNYAFTEMLNNAIDHSKAKTATIEFQLLDGNAEFWIKDPGIGAFSSIRKNFHLKDDFEAVEHLMKGKQSTAPDRHTGEGIFFTSRVADYFFIQSGKLKWIVDNELDDKSLKENPKPVKGTWVYFRLKQRSKKDLQKVFGQYTDDNYKFNKTEIIVRLSKKMGDYVSRSEARRILFGLDQFKKIIFDYKGVANVGQAFADEVYRVFQAQYPAIEIETINANSAVQFMISRAKSTGDQR